LPSTPPKLVPELIEAARLDGAGEWRICFAPIVLVYLFLQRYFIRSVAGTGLKG
jgi:ABC-type glycerol-3-phosphate transport system permease component